jgi:multidrug efflux pump subunit AcrA (membrane-fusion protein)
MTIHNPPSLSHKTITVGILAIIGIIAAAFIITQRKAPVVVDEKKSFIIDTVRVTDLSRDVLLEKSCLVKAGSQISVQAESSGKIGSIWVDSGDTVSAGQVLATISDSY